MNAAHATLAIVLVIFAIPMAVLLTPLAIGAFVASAALWAINAALQPEWRPIGGAAA